MQLHGELKSLAALKEVLPVTVRRMFIFHFRESAEEAVARARWLAWRMNYGTPRTFDPARDVPPKPQLLYCLGETPAQALLRTRVMSAVGSAMGEARSN
jgi:hypothetical protein